MSKFLSKFKLKVAQQSKRNVFDLSSNHFTTMDFFVPRISYIHECIPGEKLKVDMNTFTRLSPLTEPFFGSCRIKNLGFFVPMRVIFHAFNEFITQSPYNNQFISTVPTISHDLIRTELIALSQQVTDSEAYDFRRGSVYYRFNSLGYRLYNLLASLGYKINFDDFHTGNYSFSLLPLLAYAKLYSDWLTNPTYNDYSSAIDNFILSNPTSITQDQFHEFFVDNLQDIHLPSDYFTSAWDSPVGPNSQDLPSISIQDITLASAVSTSKSQVRSDSNFGNSTPVVAQSSGGRSVVSSFSQYIIDSLKHLSDYVKRYQLSGVRPLDKYMAERGIQLNSAKLNRSVYLGSHINDIQISDVMQTGPDSVSDVPTQGVGNFAGKGISDLQSISGNFEYETDEFGYFMVVSYVEPNISYVDGCPRMLQHLSRFDFFTPDFDNLGPQAIRMDEIFANVFKGNNSPVIEPDSVFGYTPRYSEYKTAQDNLTGDFLFNAKNQSLDGWLLARRHNRTFKPNGFSYSVHNNSFTLANSSEFNNIFADQTNRYDHFFVQFRFNVKAYLPAMPLYDTYDFHSEGREMLANLGGTQVTN